MIAIPLTPRQAAAAIGVSRTTLYRLVNSGQLEAIRIHRVLRIDPAAIARFKAAHRVPLPQTSTPTGRRLPAVVPSDLGTNRYVD